MRTHTRAQRRGRAFTLLETLVVISVIALLIALFMPSLARARRQAKATMCLSNMRGLGIAVHVYANNNHDHLVTAALGHSSDPNPQGAWINTLREEYGSELLLRCPSDESPYWDTPLPPDGLFRRVSYATNWYTVAPVGGAGPYDRFGVFRRPGSTIYIVDLAEDGAYAVYDHVHPETWFSNPGTLAGQQVALDRHLGRSNYAFIDGHAEPLTFEQTYRLDPSAGFPPVFIVNKYDPAIAR